MGGDPVTHLGGKELGRWVMRQPRVRSTVQSRTLPDSPMARFSFRGSEQPQQRNQRLLMRYEQRRSTQQRNALVEANLPLVARIASHQSRHTDLGFDDLFQLGCLGLIQAVEGFKPDCSGALSTYAVPVIRGSMQHHLRDQHQPLRSPHRLRTLQAKAGGLQLLRQQRGLPLLSEAELAEVLGVRPERLQEARRLHQALRVRSLDEPVPQVDGRPQPLVELLPAREAEAAPDPALLWLRSRLKGLPDDDRRLLLGRFRDNCSWIELAARHGCTPRLLQRRVSKLLEELRQASLSDWASPMASNAATRV